MTREAFLARVRQAAQAGRMYRSHVRMDLGAEVGYVGAGDDPVDRMAAEVIAVGGQASIVSDLDAARHRLSEILAAHQPRSAFCWRHPLLDRLGLGPLLASLAIESFSHADLAPLPLAEQRVRILAAGIGITSATRAIAETGSLAMSSAPGSERLASLAPPVHVAIIEQQQILSDLFDLFAQLQQSGVENLPSNLTLITGPSKTGDIELKLTTGVHGPGHWYVIIIRQTPQPSSPSSSSP